MKDKDIIKTEELERINNELFDSFDPVDETWIGGAWDTLTSSTTFTPSGFDAQMDVDWHFAEIEPGN